MANDFLTAAWFLEILSIGKDLPNVPGADLKIEFEINKIPKGHELAGKKVRVLGELKSGKLKRFEIATPEDIKTLKSQVQIRCEYGDALDVSKGKLDPNVGYMQGRLKLDGAYDLVLFGLRDFWNSKPWANFWKQVHSSL